MKALVVRDEEIVGLQRHESRQDPFVWQLSLLNDLYYSGNERVVTLS
jgi:hypothetical protein